MKGLWLSWAWISEKAWAFSEIEASGGFRKNLGFFWNLQFLTEPSVGKSDSSLDTQCLKNWTESGEESDLTLPCPLEVKKKTNNIMYFYLFYTVNTYLKFLTVAIKSPLDNTLVFFSLLDTFL